MAYDDRQQQRHRFGAHGGAAVGVELMPLEVLHVAFVFFRRFARRERA
jgi:hypothetical protein